jgi:hypothetical protein
MCLPDSVPSPEILGLLPDLGDGQCNHEGTSLSYVPAGSAQPWSPCCRLLRCLSHLPGADLGNTFPHGTVSVSTEKCAGQMLGESHSQGGLLVGGVRWVFIFQPGGSQTWTDATSSRGPSWGQMLTLGIPRDGFTCPGFVPITSPS